MAVNKMTVDEMAVDEMTLNKMTVNKVAVYSRSTQDFLRSFLESKVPLS